MYCSKLGISIVANKIVKGKIADILAYGFSGNRPYHFSSIYFKPCAIKIANGKTKNITASGLKPVMITVNTSNKEAIELRDAKKPLVVENRPISAKASCGKLINGAKNTLFVPSNQARTGEKPAPMFGKKSLPSKLFAKSSSIIELG